VVTTDHLGALYATDTVAFYRALSDRTPGVGRQA